jgi:hypothetical protein
VPDGVLPAAAAAPASELQAAPEATATPEVPKKHVTMRQVMDGKKELKQLIGEALAPVLDKGKSSVMSSAERFMKSPGASDDDQLKSVGAAEALACVRSLAEQLRHVDYNKITIDNFADEKATIERQVLELDAAFSVLEEKLSEFETLLSERKKDFVKYVFSLPTSALLASYIVFEHFLACFPVSPN